MNLQILDETELIRQLESLKTENKELIRINKNNKAWLALLAHDFKSTFASVIWTAGLLKKKTVSEEILAQLWPELEMSARRNVRAVDDTLLAAKMQLDGSFADREFIQLKELFADIKVSLSDALTEKELTFSFFGEKDATVLASRVLVRVILTKIIENAIKFSYRGGGIQFRVGLSDEGAVYIAIEDSGVGMDAYTLDSLFSFEVGPALGTENESGAGLGLVLIKEVLNLMNGTIEVRSNKGMGTQIQISL